MPRSGRRVRVPQDPGVGALTGIYAAVLWRYASTGEAGLFDPAVVGNASRRRRQKATFPVRAEPSERSLSPPL